jgi:cytidine deaminase
MTAQELVKIARELVGEFRLSTKHCSVGSVAAALVTKNGKIFTGICIDLACGIGFCAEHAAIAEMLKSRETEIDMIVAVNDRGVMPPCGRCREMMYQINRNNLKTKVVIKNNKIVRLDELLPHRWG